MTPSTGQHDQTDQTDQTEQGDLAGGHLRRYVNFHLTGAAAATQLAGRLAEDTGAAELHQLHAELKQEQEVLEEVLDALDLHIGRVQRVASAVAEQVLQLPRQVLEIADEDLRELLDLEMLLTGIEGKRALWRSLLAIGDVSEVVARVPLEELDVQAERQQHQVEALRIAAARRVLVDAPGPQQPG